MSKNGILILVFGWVALTLLAEPAWAQRMRFPSVVEVNQPAGGTTYSAPGSSVPITGSAPAMPPAGAMPSGAYPGATPPSSYPAASGVTPPAMLGSGAAPAAAPILPAPSYGPAPPSYGGTPTVGAGPTASFGGAIAPPAGWDPNAIPSNQPGSLLSQDPYMASPQFQWPSMEPVMTMRKFIQEVRGDYTYIGGNDVNRLNMHDVIVTSTFAVPFLYSREHPLLVTPGFGFHFLSPTQPAADLPGTLYDAFIDTEWNPQLSPWLGAELGVRLGVYSDFKKVTGESIRWPAQGFAVLKLAPSVDIKFGVMYLDRVHINVLPSGGVIWRPNSDNRFDILFPNPKLSHRLGSDGVTEWWLYARGDYGGGDWQVTRDVPAPSTYQRVDYNDMRVALGLEFRRRAGLNGLVEVGYAFEREVMYASDKPTDTFTPGSAIFLRGSLAY